MESRDGTSGCSWIVYEGVSSEAFAAEVAAWFEASVLGRQGAARSGQDAPERVQLPAGEALHASLSVEDATLGLMLGDVYHMQHDGTLYWLGCFSLVPPTDAWFSVAETIDLGFDEASGGTGDAVERSPASILGEQLAELSDMLWRADTLRREGDYAAARELQEQVLEARTRILGPDHPETLSSMGNLAWTLSEQGECTAARQLLEQVLETRTRILGPEHPASIKSSSLLAFALWEEGDLAGARELLEQVLETSIRVLGSEHDETLLNREALDLVLEELESEE